MQYTIKLAGDIDADWIRKRVAERRESFDALPGLAHKSFLFSQDDRLYAPFYIWNDHESAREFLMSELFNGVMHIFGRPRVRIWGVLNFDCVNPDIDPKYAVREVDILAQDDDLSQVAESETVSHSAALVNEGLHSHVIALDADRWEFVRYSLWRDKNCAKRGDGDCVDTYEVLHLSTPNSSPVARRVAE